MKTKEGFDQGSFRSLLSDDVVYGDQDEYLQGVLHCKEERVSCCSCHG